MTQADSAPSFYEDLPRIAQFDVLSEASSYRAVPSDWVVGVADVKGSTQAVAAGQYKTVNMVGAAVISAQINQMGGNAFPYVFGGDGAAFALAPHHRDGAVKALAAVRRWAKTEFDVELRAAVISVRDVLDAGRTLGVARFQASQGVDYAMFNGGGVSWAESQMKAGHYDIPAAPEGTFPDLTGLSCRWSPTKSKNGTILSLVLQMAENADPLAYDGIVQKVVKLSDCLERSGHPVPVAGAGASWPPPGLTLEAHASRGGKSLSKTRRKLLYDTFVGWIFFKLGLKVGRFDAPHYARTVGSNADFRKFDDGLKMTLDCDSQTLAALEDLLKQAQQDGVVKYGMFQQDQAMMTCIVPSVFTDDHIHFIDGASGGYTQAATQIKAR
jgi:hypothetical protein